MQTERSRRAVDHSTQSRRLMWFSSPIFRAATTWLGLLAIIRWYGTVGMQQATHIVHDWIGRSLSPGELVTSLQDLMGQALEVVGIPLLVLAGGVVCLQHAWQVRWAAMVDRQSEAMATSPGKIARMTLSTIQWIGSLLALGVCTWWAVYAVMPMIFLSPDDDIHAVTMATRAAAWNLGLSLGVALLVAALVDVLLRARLMQPDEDTQRQLERQMRRETEGSPELRRRRRQLHRGIIG